MAKLLKKKSGFTLIELMIVVAILGILAAVAVPAFLGYMRRSKSAETQNNLKSMFYSAKAYFDKESGTRDGVTTWSKCIVPAIPMTPADPGSVKQQFLAPATPTAPAWQELSFTIAEPVYFGYSLTNEVPATCVVASNGTITGTAPVDTLVYYLTANGDLDDSNDANVSTFELAVRADAAGELVRAAGFYIDNELED